VEAAGEHPLLSKLLDESQASHASHESFQRGLAYLYQIRSLAPEPDLITVMHDPAHRLPVCTWIGQQIERVNAHLQTDLAACAACFHPWQQPVVQIFAAPLSSQFQLDGCCNLQTEPVTILVDVGRVIPADWLALVAHEYAHACLGLAGHQSEFAAVLTHLCLGLDLALPDPLPAHESAWRSVPGYRSTDQPLSFWQGRGKF
jgi:hypothetical protein